MFLILKDFVAFYEVFEREISFPWLDDYFGFLSILIFI